MLSCKRDDFYLPTGVHYLNCAFMSPMARAVEQAGIEGIRLKRNPSLLSSSDFFSASDALRDSFANLLGSGSDRISIAPSVSYGIASVARNMDLPGGSEIVMLEEQFPSHVYSWRRLASERGLKLKTVAPPAHEWPRGALWNERILDAISTNCSAVCLPTVHWTDGTRFDLVKIAARAREVGAYVVVDGTQSIGAQDFNFGAVQPDFLVAAGYKWLLGPYSMCLAYWSERFDNGIPIEENWILRRGSENFARLVDYEDEYQSGAQRYDVGERSNFILVPMMIAALNLVHDWSPDEIQAYADRLSRPVIDLARREGYLVEDNAWRSAHLFGIRVPPTRSLDRLRAELNEAGISASIRGSAIRVAVHVFNDESDMDALASVLVSSSHSKQS